MNIAIVGSGIAGLGAARALAGSHDVTLYEAAAQPGGHVHTAHVDGLAVDLGFIVCNRERYPLFFRLLAELGIETRPTTMSFSVALPHSDLEWGSASLAAMFADRVAILHDGKLLAVGRAAEVLTSDLILQAFGVHVSVVKHPELDTPLIIPLHDFSRVL